MTPRASRKRDVYNFAIVKNFPKYKSFEIIRQPEGDFFSAFMKTFSQLFKGE